MSKKILIAGVDGYIGWALANELMDKGYSVYGVDAFFRRSTVKSLYPISSKDYRKDQLYILSDDIRYSSILSELLSESPDAIIHLAEQPSAPFSMTYNGAMTTQSNNVLGTLRLLFLIKEHCPSTHLIKIGTMGEYGCYDDKTEILTEAGWTPFAHLRGDEKVATRSKHDRSLVFKVPNSVHEYDFDGNLYCLQNNRLDIAVTPNHRTFTVKRSNSNYCGLREEIAETIINKPRTYDIGLEWEGNNKESFEVLGKNIDTTLWLKFLGWFLSEGSVEVRKDRSNAYRVIIKQKTIQSHETKRSLLALADTLNITFHEYFEDNISIFVLSNKDFANYLLKRFGRSKDKFIPLEIKRLNFEYLNTLLAYMLAGDGCKHHRGFRYFSISKRLADDVQEIALKCGWAATISSKIISSESILYTVGISKSVYAHVNHDKDNFNDSWIPYKGKVYCVNVGGDGIIFVRRNGKPYWSGNTPDCIIPEGMIPIGCSDEPNRYCPMQGLMFPRSPGSFYHLSKVFDSLNIKFACDTWGLRSTDIMQGIVFGLAHETRFDYDENFGTVINRFCAQALAGIPLTIYGKGGQTRGFLPLTDSLKCLQIAIDNPPPEGTYRTFNQFAHIMTINECAALVYKVANELGISTKMQYIPNPRKESEDHTYHVVTDALHDLGYEPNLDFTSVIRETLITLIPYKSSINKDIIYPTTNWR